MGKRPINFMSSVAMMRSKYGGSMAQGDSLSIRGRIAVLKASQVPGASAVKSKNGETNVTTIYGPDDTGLGDCRHMPDWMDKYVGPLVKPVAMGIMGAAGLAGANALAGAAAGPLQWG
jgi:hypothetical protein